ncbi:MAG: hypothetical protein HKN16_04990, partial [Saprospiraceae bacterium]|nr:hypothetical protein [Saprospiraceae bacterium]
MYSEISSNPSGTEEEWARSVLDQDASSSAYRQLKSKLTKKLINNLFLTDPNEAQFNSYAKAYLNGRKLVYAVNILSRTGARAAAKILAEKAFRLADKYTLSFLALESLQHLWNHAVVSMDRKKIRYYSEKYERFNNIRQREMKATQFVLKARQIEIDFQDFDDEEIEELIQEVRSLFPEKGDPDLSVSFIADIYSAHTILLRVRNKNLDVIRYSTEAIEHLKLFHFIPAIFQLSSYMNILRASISLKEYEHGGRVKEEILQLSQNIKGINKIFIYQRLIEFALQTERYDVALEIYTQGTSFPIFKKAPSYLAETFRIFAAYLSILIGEGMLEDPQGTLSRNFRMGKFMNSKLEITKLKEGQYVGFLLVQIIFFLKRKDFEEVIDRVDSMSSYASRNLKNARTIRAYYFTRMIETLPKSDFHLSAVQRKSERWIKKLVES